MSGADHPANRQLKLAMGFGVEPMERDEPTLAFVMPLRPGSASVHRSLHDGGDPHAVEAIVV